MSTVRATCVSACHCKSLHPAVGHCGGDRRVLFSPSRCVLCQVSLILTVGLSVDYSLHIAHGFLTGSGTKRQRAVAALEGLGVSVFNGATATFLSVVGYGACAHCMPPLLHR